MKRNEDLVLQFNMDSRYRLNDSETERTQGTSESPLKAAPKSEKLHAALARLLFHEWLTQALRLLVLTMNDGFSDKAIKAWIYGSYFVFYSNELTLHCLIERYF